MGVSEWEQSCSDTRLQRSVRRGWSQDPPRPVLPRRASRGRQGAPVPEGPAVLQSERRQGRLRALLQPPSRGASAQHCLAQQVPVASPVGSCLPLAPHSPRGDGPVLQPVFRLLQARPSVSQSRWVQVAVALSLPGPSWAGRAAAALPLSPAHHGDSDMCLLDQEVYGKCCTDILSCE